VSESVCAPHVPTVMPSVPLAIWNPAEATAHMAPLTIEGTIDSLYTTGLFILMTTKDHRAEEEDAGRVADHEHLLRRARAHHRSEHYSHGTMRGREFFVTLPVD